MVRRVVDTSFWSSTDVIDHYSVEDKFFALYLMTNGRTTQSGIYSLPKKIMTFETGYTNEVIQVLLERFSNKYKQIVYSESTQELTLLKSLEYTILKGGKPVSDLLARELREVKDPNLILETYWAMEEFWKQSVRKFDQTIQDIFETELVKRKLIPAPNQNDSENENDNDIVNDIGNENENHNENDNENDNEESPHESLGTNRSTNRGKTLLMNSDGLLTEELAYLKKYVEFIKYKNPSFSQTLTTKEIVPVFYEEVIGPVTPGMKEKMVSWEKELPKSLILEAFIRSIDKYNPLAYATSIINDWQMKEVKSLSDLSKLDRAFSRQKD
ncbi:MAG: DnaD domain protein [Atopostipes sp.]|nr:DnaD domain protein [Atopostipes sp.]